MNLIQAISQASALMGRLPPELRMLVLNLVRDVIAGDDRAAVEKAKRAAIAAAAKRAIG
jgi:hypothetical protein